MYNLNGLAFETMLENTKKTNNGNSFMRFAVEHHLIERIIELDADHAKGTPIFIEP